MSRVIASLLVTLLALRAPVTQAHGDHGHGIAFDDNAIDDRSYMQKHAAEEHHLDDFDVEAFFHLHDLNRNGYLEAAEIESIYGVNHPTAIAGSGYGSPASSAERKQQEAAMEAKRKAIVEKVLKSLDADGDGRISRDEFVNGGIEGLPSFVGWKGLGHHYGSEEEYFLHHEELYHNTPETQTDESYNHPEDIAHFAEHEHIEAEEDARERDFEGLASDAPLDTDRAIADPLDSHAHGSQDHILTGEDPESHQVPFKRPQGSSQGRPARIERTKPKPEDLNKLKAEVEQGHGGIWGAWGEKDMMRPRNDKERMRKNTPYKYKMGRNNEF